MHESGIGPWPTFPLSSSCFRAPYRYARIRTDKHTRVRIFCQNILQTALAMTTRGAGFCLKGREQVCMRLFVYISILAWSSGQALADPCADFGKSYSAIGMAECSADTFSKADASLNEIYQKVVAHLKESGRDLKPLVAAERAWIVERDARCDQRAKEYDLIDASGTAVIFDCKTEWTNARIATLRDYLTP